MRIAATVCALLCALVPVFSGPALSADAATCGEAASAASPSAARGLKAAAEAAASKGDYKSASDYYMKAAAAEDANALTADELTAMAVHVSWAERYADSLELLKKALAKDPANKKARVHRARVLGWAGRFDESIDEADAVLASYPSDADAMLVMANSLNWSGRRQEAAALYGRRLELSDDFDARAGLANALAADGRLEAAIAERARLARPAYKYQEDALKALDAQIERVRRENRRALDAALSHYADSDYNRVDRYSLAYSWRQWSKRLTLAYRHTDATDQTRSRAADELTLGGPLGGSVSGQAGARLLDTADGRKGYPAVRVSADLTASGQRFRVTVSHDALTDTAQLIENGIRMTDVNASGERQIAQRLSLYGSLSFRSYSDDNGAVDAAVSPVYTILTEGPALAAGYRLRFMDFRKESGGGYFDPSGFVSNQAFLRLSGDDSVDYYYLEPYIGHQSYTRGGSSTSGLFKGGYALVGRRLSEDLKVEAHIEGGDYAAGAAAGFTYYEAGIRAVYTCPK